MQHLSPSLRARRTRGRILVLAVVIALCALMGTANAEPRKARPARATADPLLVHLDTISPATLSDEDEPVTITGTVANVSDEQWTEINLYAIRSAAPIVDTPALAASAGTAAAGEFVGERVITPGTEATVDVLEPGQTADFSLTVPRSELGLSVSGVYWLGVQASGLTATLPKDTFADGRALHLHPAGATHPQEGPRDGGRRDRPAGPRDGVVHPRRPDRPGQALGPLARRGRPAGHDPRGGRHRDDRHDGVPAGRPGRAGGRRAAGRGQP
ncbi:DUF6049 family protein [Nocardioides sp. B-3]|uniref:DUF6049 family protein n=1 Tax=Nocardioides sp. B-3 TaxID=2895565 RepID=UPI0021522BAA|nr:DUF6049 family protein [Nocardioides sp. B-3]UUZ61106.1 DUF6049 family protein [Nocardioides sp. B-3]